ncbi:unnamed protein product [Peniophora sp. CBMAI 1063]|nr:unnamed protein product [Peniophora sp. CBMAI 1063]
MQRDLEYFRDLHHQTSRPRNAALEKDTSASVSRGGPAGRGRGRALKPFRGRGRRGVMLAAEDAHEGHLSALPPINSYGRQAVSSSMLHADRGFQYADGAPILPAKRRRTGMTDMLYGDDFPSEDESAGPLTRKQSAGSHDAAAQSPASDEDEQFISGEETLSPYDFSQGLTFEEERADDIKNPSSRLATYTHEELRGPATAFGLPAFPHRSKPQEANVMPIPNGPPITASGPVRRMLKYQRESNVIPYQTHVDYIREFAATALAPIRAYAILEREVPPPPLCEICQEGGERAPTWRCDCCDEQRYLCKRCMASAHFKLPYHRVKWYNGRFYEDAWLRDSGVYIALCPRRLGGSCPTAPHRPEVPDGFWSAPPPRYVAADVSPISPDGSDRDAFEPDSGAHPADPPDPRFGSEPLDEGEVESGAAPLDDYTEPWTRRPASVPPVRPCHSREAEYDPRGLRALTICHDNGIHAIGVQFCACSGAAARDLQLIAKGIYPASRKDPSTGFTFRCLDRFLIDNLESDTAAESFARKLQRLSIPDNPDLAPNRYPELIRCGREYRAIVQLIEHGFSHQDLTNWQPPGQGDLIYKCVICPSPEENMRNGWETKDNSWAHFYSFNIDGNFEGQHTTSRVPENNQPLYPGTGAFNHPDEAAYALRQGRDDHSLSQAQKDRVGHIPCHNHQAASNLGKSRNPTTDIKGIGAIVCARHGCFVPGALNNFSLGETQIPVDYSLNNAFRVCDFSKIRRLQILYDINCQYSVHLEERFKAAGYSWPHLQHLLLGVGVWHIYGHILECFSRFSPLYAYRCGVVDGEIVETLWSVLNEILGSCRGMSLAHREEVINFKVRDMNWKKIGKAGESFAFLVPEPKVTKRTAYLNKISESCAEDDLRKWDDLRKELEDRRSRPMPADDRRADRQDDRGPRFADGRLDTVEEEPSLAGAEAELLEDEALADDGAQLVRPIVAAMKLQAEQIQLQIAAREPAGTEELRLEREKWRARLASSIGRSNSAMARLLDDEGGSNATFSGETPLAAAVLDADMWPETTMSGPSTRGTRPRSEYRAVDLPSTRWDGPSHYHELDAVRQRAIRVERRLREVEARVRLFKLRTAS